MDELYKIIKVIGCIAVLAMTVIPFVLFKRMRDQHGKLSDMSSDELRALAEKQPLLHCNKVLEELKTRDEDITFAIPLLLKLAIDKNVLAHLLGWSGLKHYFADIFPDLDFSKNKPNRDERNRMMLKLNKIESQQQA